MKKAVMVSAILLLCSMSRAQETAPAPSSSGNGSGPLAQDARINALEVQVRTLAEQVALLKDRSC